MDQLMAFEVKYLGPTNHRGARVKLTCSLLEWAKVISYDYEFCRSCEIAENWLKSKGAKVKAFAQIRGRTVFLVEWESGLEVLRQSKK